MKAGSSRTPRVIDEGYILNSQQSQDIRRVRTFTSLFRVADGSLLAIYRLGSAKDAADGNCQLARSEDGGCTWEILCEGFDNCPEGMPGEIRSASLTQSKSGTLLAFLTWIDQSSADPRLYASETDVPKLRRLVRVESDDGGRTWSPGQILDTGSLSRPVLSGPAVQLPDMGWLLPVENYAPEQAGGPSVHSAHILLTNDSGSVDRVLTVARHDEDRLYYWDQRQALCPDGKRLVSLFWTYDRKREQDIDIHISWAEVESLSWQVPSGTGIKGQIAAPIPLPENRLLAFFVRRDSPGSLRLITSVDGGITWDHDKELVVYQQGNDRHSGQPQDYAEAWEQMGQWTFGHPSAVLLEDRLLLIAYYAGDDEHCLSARWARVQI